MRKIVPFSALALIAVLVLSACGAAQSTDSTPAARIVSVSGTGRVTLAPDIAYINIGVHTEMSSVSEALASNSSQTQKVVDELTKLGVEAKDIQTMNFNVYPYQAYGPDGAALDLKYVVDNTINVTVRDLNQMGAMLDAVVRSGANNINSIQFDVENKEEAYSQARKAAVDNAHSQAVELADAAGFKLGPVQSLNVYSNNTPVTYYDNKGGSGATMQASVPISAGQLVIEVSVNISYAIQ